MPSNDELKCAQSEPTSGFDNNSLSSSAEDMLSVSKDRGKKRSYESERSEISAMVLPESTEFENLGEIERLSREELQEKFISMLAERKKTCEKLKAIESTSSHYQKMAEELSDEKRKRMEGDMEQSNKELKSLPVANGESGKNSEILIEIKVDELSERGIYHSDTFLIYKNRDYGDYECPKDQELMPEIRCFLLNNPNGKVVICNSEERKEQIRRGDDDLTNSENSEEDNEVNSEDNEDSNL